MGSSICGIPLDDELKEIVVRQSDIKFMQAHEDQFEDHMILRVSAATLLPGQGLKDLFGEDTKYYSVLGNLILTY